MKRQLKIGFVVGNLGIGGAEKQLYYMIKSLHERQVSVRVFHFTKGEYYEQKLLELGVAMKYIGSKNFPPFRMFNLLIQILLFRPSIIQSTHSYVNFYVGIIGKLLNISTIGAVRNHIDRCKKFNKRSFSLLLKWPDLILFNSSVSMNALKKMKVVPDNKLMVIPNVIDLTSYKKLKQKSDKLKIAYLGKLNSGKAVHILIEALALIRHHTYFDSLEVWIIGDGQELTQLEELALQLGVAEQVKFWGNQSNIHQLLFACQIFVFPSLSEGFPNVIIEAMAAGLAVISTPVGEVPFIIDNHKTGLIVAYNDVEEMANRIHELIQNQTVRTNLGFFARLMVFRRYNYHHLYQKLMDTYLYLANFKGNKRLVQAINENKI